jgi:hypothetical protein
LHTAGLLAMEDCKHWFTRQVKYLACASLADAFLWRVLSKSMLCAQSPGCLSVLAASDSTSLASFRTAHQLMLAIAQAAGDTLPCVFLAAKDDLGMSQVWRPRRFAPLPCSSCSSGRRMTRCHALVEKDNWAAHHHSFDLQYAIEGAAGAFIHRGVGLCRTW